MAISTYLLIITLNVNGLNSPIKRHRVAEWIKKKNKTHLCVTYKRLTSNVRNYINIFSGHKGMKLEINLKNKMKKLK